MQVFTILGSHPNLSNTEFEQVTGIAPSLHSQEVSIFDDVSIEVTKLQARLGGMQKMGSVIASFSDYKHEELAELLVSFLMAETREKKITFGISIYDLGNPSRANKLQQKRQALGLEIKKLIKSYGNSVRYVTSKGTTLSSVDITKNQILKRGAEFCFLVTGKEVLIGQTISVQDYEDWSHRDYDRPRRNAKRGMLPPKLARMMINLSGIDPVGKNILDPFCGSGTVLMEAVMLGFEHVLGADVSGGAVNDTKLNMEWLASQGHAVEELDIYESKAANIHALVAEESIDLVVAELFLGKPRQGEESESEIRHRVKDLTNLYKESFASIARVMRKGGKAVIAFPMNFVHEKKFAIPVEEVVKASGLKIVGRPVLYRHEGQFVGREIYTLEK